MNWELFFLMKTLKKTHLVIIITAMMLLLAQSVNSAPIGVIAPVTIYDPGEYQLLNDDLGEAGTAIEIAASNVVFDGNGHTISGIGTNSGVFAKQHTNIQVKNLNINNFTTWK